MRRSREVIVLLAAVLLFITLAATAAVLAAMVADVAVFLVAQLLSAVL